MWQQALITAHHWYEQNSHHMWQQWVLFIPVVSCNQCLLPHMMWVLFIPVVSCNQCLLPVATGTDYITILSIYNDIFITKTLVLPFQ
jgi:hypothetical protein